MVRTHPQWLRTREIVRPEHSRIASHHRVFSYFNDDSQNIRNVPEWGGGALMDIGCYPIQFSRFLTGLEPDRVMAAVERDPNFHTDRLTTAILDFSGVHSLFTCSTQMVPYQKVQILGTKSRIELEIPFNAPPDRPCRLFLDTGVDLFGGGVQEEHFTLCDQYAIQGDLFSRAIRGDGEVPTPLEDAMGNMAVIEALTESARTGCWVASGAS
ncbi:MAG: Gfo/Idh/MocA family oxidoreductase [Bryobacteraceae bacterium]